MIDSGRHFQSIQSIKNIIDSLPYAKLNVLHIHMADDQSFPLQSTSAPKLWQGSFSPQERYLQSDMTEVVDYAHYRGIRVMVEFDMPAHASAMCPGYPQICPSMSCRTPLNVANNATFDLIHGLMMEMTGGRPSTPGNPSPGLFKDNFIHLGGDEVNTACWTNTPSIAAWLKQKGYTADQAYGYFVDTVARMALAQGHRPVQWSEVFDHFQDKLAKGTIVHIWKPNTNVTQVVALGYNVLINVGYVSDSWYLDNLDVTWDAVYGNEPCVGVPASLCPMIYGGHGEMWGETVDVSDLQQTVWPKLGSIAERLWSPRTTTSLTLAHPRLEYFRCLLNQRGVAAAPVNNKNARQPPPNPGSCYAQRKK
jgi:hexosaminidase